MSTTEQHPRLLSLGEAADRLGVSVMTIRRRVWAGDLPAIRVGPTDRHPLRVDPAELDRWLDAHQVAPEPREAA